MLRDLYRVSGSKEQGLTICMGQNPEQRHPHRSEDLGTHMTIFGSIRVAQERKDKKFAMMNK
jgi:hypothetical protein